MIMIRRQICVDQGDMGTSRCLTINFCSARSQLILITWQATWHAESVYDWKHRHCTQLHGHVHDSNGIVSLNSYYSHTSTQRLSSIIILSDLDSIHLIHINQHWSRWFVSSIAITVCRYHSRHEMEWAIQSLQWPSQRCAGAARHWPAIWKAYAISSNPPLSELLSLRLKCSLSRHFFLFDAQAS
jgi:hypothetical protein